MVGLKCLFKKEKPDAHTHNERLVKPIAFKKETKQNVNFDFIFMLISN
jgi:hypothetical protein